jgi:hypothetical protein
MQRPEVGRPIVATFLERCRQRSRTVCLRQELEQGRTTIKALESQLTVLTDLLLESASECNKLRFRYERMCHITTRLQGQRPSAIGEAEEVQANLGECIACRDRERSVVLTPCDHLVLCSKCAVDNDDQRCPVCRVEVDVIMRVHT